MARTEQLEELRDLAYERAKAAIEAGDLQGANKWSSFAVKLEESLWQIFEKKRQWPDNLDPQELWQKWWESVDEIVFLYIGLTLSFMAEIVARILQPVGILIFSFLVLASVAGYILLKWKKWKRKSFLETR